MTKPTQAQIEAAADAMERCMFAKHELPLDAELHGKYLDTAKAALTASAAAEAQDDLYFSTAQANWHLDRIAKNTAATIERCAQKCDDGTECGQFYAAAIRALKG